MVRVQLPRPPTTVRKGASEGVSDSSRLQRGVSVSPQVRAQAAAETPLQMPLLSKRPALWVPTSKS